MIEKLSSNELLIHKYNQSKYSVNVSRQSIGLILGRVGSGLLRPKTRLDRNQVWLPKTRLNPKNRVYNQVSFSSHGSSLGLDFFFFFFLLYYNGYYGHQDSSQIGYSRIFTNSICNRIIFCN